MTEHTSTTKTRCGGNEFFKWTGKVFCVKRIYKYRKFSRCCGKTGMGGDGNVKIEKRKFKKYSNNYSF